METINIGRHIKILRKNKKLSQQQLTDEMNRHFPPPENEKNNYYKSQFSRWENDETNPSISQLKQLATYFMVPIEYFFQDFELLGTDSSTNIASSMSGSNNNVTTNFNVEFNEKSKNESAQEIEDNNKRQPNQNKILDELKEQNKLLSDSNAMLRGILYEQQDLNKKIEQILNKVSK